MTIIRLWINYNEHYSWAGYLCTRALRYSSLFGVRGPTLLRDKFFMKRVPFSPAHLVACFPTRACWLNASAVHFAEWFDTYFITVLRNNRKIDTEEYRMYRNTLMIWRFLQLTFLFLYICRCLDQLTTPP